MQGAIPAFHSGKNALQYSGGKKLEIELCYPFCQMYELVLLYDMGHIDNTTRFSICLKRTYILLVWYLEVNAQKGNAHQIYRIEEQLNSNLKKTANLPIHNYVWIISYLIESIKTTSMEDFSTRVLEKKKEYLRR